MAEAGIALEVTEGQCSELAAGGDSLWVCSNGQASGSKCIMQCQEGFMNSGSAVQMTCACRNGDCEWKSNNEFRVRNLLNFLWQKIGIIIILMINSKKSDKCVQESCSIPSDGSWEISVGGLTCSDADGNQKKFNLRSKFDAGDSCSVSCPEHYSHPLRSEPFMFFLKICLIF